MERELISEARQLCRRINWLPKTRTGRLFGLKSASPQSKSKALAARVNSCP